MPTYAEKDIGAIEARVTAAEVVTSNTSAFAKTILDDVDAAAVRTTIGAGTSSVSLPIAESDVTNLVTDLTALDGRLGTLEGVPVGYTDAQIDGFLTAKAPTANPTFTGTVSGVTKAHVGLGSVDNTADSAKPVSTAQQTALDAKQSTSQKGAANGYAGLDGAGLVPVAQLPGLPTAWGAITGVLSAQTDLQSALDAKSATSHTHAGVYEPANANIQAHVASAHAPSNAQKNSDITLAEIEAKLVGVISSHSHAGGGGDPWTYLRLTSDFTTTSATAVNVTGLAFTPSANTRYEFEAFLMLRTATTTVNPRTGLAWPTGMTDGVGMVEQAQTATAVPICANGNVNAALLIAVGGLPNTTQSWPARVQGYVVAGATPSGDVSIQLASEAAGTTVRVVSGSWLKWRTVP